MIDIQITPAELEENSLQPGVLSIPWDAMTAIIHTHDSELQRAAFRVMLPILARAVIRDRV